MGSYPIHEIWFLFLILNSRPAKLLFLSTLSLGVLIAVSSNSWFITWIGLELNLLSFIPIICSRSNVYYSESAIKYFLVQAIASAIIISGTITIIFTQAAPILLILARLLLKTGAAPFHFWIPPIIQGISWTECLILITIQKLAPIILISYTNITPFSNLIIQTSSIISRVVGAIGGINQILIRKIIAYSSISHIAWILSSVSLNTTLWVHYIAIYTLITISVIYFFKLNQVSNLKQIAPIFDPKEKIRYFLSFMSLGGLPPFLGFYPKIMIVRSMINKHQFLWLLFLLARSLLTLFFYIRLIVRAFIISGPKIKFPAPGSLISPQGYLVLLTTNILRVVFPTSFSLL